MAAQGGVECSSGSPTPITLPKVHIEINTRGKLIISKSTDWSLSVDFELFRISIRS